MPDTAFFRRWLHAIRPHTLPLAAAAVTAAGLLAYQQQHFHGGIFTVMLTTAILLQIFANLANDYGDGQRGTDRHRSDRLFARQTISRASLQQALWLCGAACLASGLLLLLLSGRLWPPADSVLWLAAGALSLAAAWFYTAGRRSYGYAGWGEAAVWLFFGLLAVGGGSLLYGNQPTLSGLAAANAVGLWCAAVLNINNLRDCDTDWLAGKHTLAVRLGTEYGRHYHALLLAAATLSWSLWLVSSLPWLPTLCLLAALLWFTHRHLQQLYRAHSSSDHNRLLASLSRHLGLWILLNWLTYALTT